MVDDVVDTLVLRPDGAGGVDDVDDYIDAFERIADFVVEILNELARLGLEDAGGVDEDDLAFGAMDDAVVRVSGGLRLGRDDGDLGADEGVEERGFANVGAANEHGEAGFEGRVLFHIQI